MSRSTQILRYIIRRLFQAVPIVLAIIVLNFFLLNMAEGDAVDVLAGEAGSATPEYMAELRAKFGLDQPLPVQLLVYLKNIISLDLGYSFRHDMPVSVLIVDRFWPTLLLMISTIILAVLFGILLGLLAAININTWKISWLGRVSLYISCLGRFIHDQLKYTGGKRWTDITRYHRTPSL